MRTQIPNPRSQRKQKTAPPFNTHAKGGAAGSFLKKLLPIRHDQEAKRYTIFFPNTAAMSRSSATKSRN